jgi:tRNA (uracil-5-)-methyltransferase
MFDRADPKTPLRIDKFPIAAERIQQAMPALRDALLPSPALRRKLFQVEFLSTLSGELLLTLIYHRRLEADWENAAAELERNLQAQVIGRSRKQKLVLSQDYVEERLPLRSGEFRYRQFEQSFTQPNGQVNCRMIDWAVEQAAGIGGDLLELYCGNGNFTLPLAGQFERVLATEVAKRSMQAAHHNRRLNGVDNLELARLSAQEMASALAAEREFRRLKDLQCPLTDYRFSTIFVDPPRAGLDAATVKLAAGFDNILYISCNPDTLAENLTVLCRTHSIDALALFDQFPYTEHMECGVKLTRR